MLARDWFRHYSNIYNFLYLQLFKQGYQHLLGPALFESVYTQYTVKDKTVCTVSFLRSILHGASTSIHVWDGLRVQHEVLILRCHWALLSLHPHFQQLLSSPGLQLNEKLLGVFGGDVLGVGLVVEREILAVFLFDFFHLLVSIRLFSSVEESGSNCQGSDNHKDGYSYDTSDESRVGPDGID